MSTLPGQKLPEKNVPPIATSLPVVKIPRFEQMKLSNGLRAVLLEDPRFPSISMRLGIAGGNKLDNPSRGGVAETMAGMMTDGTMQRSALEIAEESGLVGAHFQFSASDDFFIGSGMVLEDGFEAFLDLFSECLLDSAWPPDELALRKQNRIHELVVERSEAGYWADARIFEQIFGQHPYSITSPEPAHIGAIERDDLIAMWRAAISPQEAVLVLVGDLPERGRLLSLLEGALGRWTNAGASSAERPKLESASPNVRIIHRTGSVQAEVRLGRRAISRGDADYFPLTVLNSVLGGGASSRLFTEIREKQGLAYHVSSSLSALVEGGILVLTTQVSMDRVGDVIRGLHHELRRLTEEAIPEAELLSVRNYLNGTFALRLESHSSLANQISGIKLLGLGDDYLEMYTRRIAEIPASVLLETAQRYFRPEEYSIVVAGDAAVLAPQLEALGKIVVEEPV